MNYIKMSPLTGMVGYGGGGTGLTFNNPSSAKWYGDRGCWFGGDSSGNKDIIDYVSIPSTGNASDFGDLTTANRRNAACSDNITAIISGGDQRGANYEYITFSTTGNATDSSDMTMSRGDFTSFSDGIIGFMIGNDNGVNADYIDYFTIANRGNCADFGDAVHRAHGLASCTDNTRAVYGQGRRFDGGEYIQEDIEYITTATTGNGTDFGDLERRMGSRAVSDGTRGVFMCGTDENYSTSQTMKYITIQTTGNGSVFGDMGAGTANGGSCGNDTRGLLGSWSGSDNQIRYITIDSTGNGTDFGDLTLGRGQAPAASGD